VPIYVTDTVSIETTEENMKSSKTDFARKTPNSSTENKIKTTPDLVITGLSNETHWNSLHLPSKLQNTLEQSTSACLTAKHIGTVYICLPNCKTHWNSLHLPAKLQNTLEQSTSNCKTHWNSLHLPTKLQNTLEQSTSACQTAKHIGTVYICLPNCKTHWNSLHLPAKLQNTLEQSTSACQTTKHDGM
jgi:hypothetical protein